MPAEARKAYETALAIRQKLADAHPTVTEYQINLATTHNNLGILLRATGAAAEARKAYETALAIQQKLADAHPTVTEYQSDLATSHNNLGHLVERHRRAGRGPQGVRDGPGDPAKAGRRPPLRHRVPEQPGNQPQQPRQLCCANRAPAEARKADETALAIQQKLADAHPTVAEYQSRLATSHNGLGIMLSKTGAPAEARKAFETALAIQQKLAREHPESPEYASAVGGTLNNTALIDIGARRFAEARVLLQQAIDWQKKALAANPRNPTYRQFLANHLTDLIAAARGLGRDDLAAAAQGQLAELNSSDPQFAAVEARLAAVIRGAAPKDNPERLALAQRAYDTTQYATAAKLWADALADDPKLAQSRETQHCYDAACAAALAGSGKGKDDPAPAAAAKAKLRHQARDWLKSELAAWSKLLQTGPPQARQAIAQTLQHWHDDTDLAGVRETEALQKLPAEERKDWEALWAEWKDLLKKTRGARP